MTRTIAVTGAGGYIGSVLVGQLLQAGHIVKVMDRFFFGEEALRSYHGHPRLEIQKSDIRDISARDFEGFEVTIDLAALSNDPSGDLDPNLTRSINQMGRIGVARAAMEAGVQRHVFASSCSVYGAGDGLSLTEKSPLAPLTHYARSCVMAEEAIRPMNGPGFTTVAMRNGTVFGLSPRMRFDLVVNLMTVNAFETGRITVMGGGRQWRPLVHVQDVALAFVKAIEAPAERVGGEAFNVGLANLQVHEIAGLVRDALPFPVEIVVAPGDQDVRDYNVDFSFATSRLHFTATRGVTEGALEIYEALSTGRVTFDDSTKTAVWYSQLLSAQSMLQEGARPAL